MVVVVVVEVVVVGVLPSEAAAAAMKAVKAKVVMDDTASLIMCLSLYVCYPNDEEYYQSIFRTTTRDVDRMQCTVLL